MKKRTISKLFLYRHRYKIGYTLLTLAFFALVFLMPLISPDGLSQNEMQSAVDSSNLSVEQISQGQIIDLPYHLLQKASIKFLGLSTYSIKLPSIIIGALLGLLLILLLNRWFKNNVAIIASVLTVLSSSFLYLAGSGTPLIMLVFWPTLLLWLGSKIQGEGRPRPLYCFVFAIALLLSIFTPYLAYLAIFIILYAIVHPHLRFTIKRLPKLPLILTGLIIIAGVGVIAYGLVTYPAAIPDLLFTNDFSINQFFTNLNTAFLPFFTWSGTVESIFLAPLVGLASVALAITGLISTAKGFFASRNSIATYLIIFTILISGLHPDCAILIILPLAILIAHGVRYILEKWYNLFPENPYARIFGLIPISILLGLIIISDLTHFAFGYRYSPPVANQFVNDLALIHDNLDENSTLLVPSGTLEFEFYSILSKQGRLTVSTVPTPSSTTVASLGKWPVTSNFELKRIVTSPKSANSDRIYIYTVK